MLHLQSPINRIADILKWLVFPECVSLWPTVETASLGESNQQLKWSPCYFRLSKEAFPPSSPPLHPEQDFMYRLPRLGGLNLHYKPIRTSHTFCRHCTNMAGDQGVTASAGPSGFEPRENAIREVKILMLHGKITFYKKAVTGTLSHCCGSSEGLFSKSPSRNLQRTVDIHQGSPLGTRLNRWLRFKRTPSTVSPKKPH